MYALLLFATLAADKPVLVVDARIQGEQPNEALVSDVAKVVGAPASSQAGSWLARRLPKVAAGTGKTEAVIEADRLAERGHEEFLDGHFVEATTHLTQARDFLSQAIESFDEERKAAESLFRAQMYLALSLHRQGGEHVAQATEILKETIRSFPQVEPNYSEYGPEPVRLYRTVKSGMDQGPMGRLRVHAAKDGVGVYLNGRLIGVTPVDLSRVYPGHYRVHARRGTELSRVREIDLKPGDNTVFIDVEFDRSIRTDGELALVYDNPTQRKIRYRRHVAALARLLDAGGALVLWRDGVRAHVAFVSDEGDARELDVGVDEVARVAPDVRSGKLGTFVKSDFERPRRVWTWVAGGIAVGAVASGVILGLSANSDFDTLKQRHPDGTITPQDADLRDSGQTKQTAANVLMGVGAAAALGTALLYWYEGRPNELERAQFSATVGPSFAGAQVRFAF